jgi:hypothetical protein
MSEPQIQVTDLTKTHHVPNREAGLAAILLAAASLLFK